MFRISLFAALFLIAHISLVGEDVAIRAAAASTSTPRQAPAAEPAVPATAPAESKGPKITYSQCHVEGPYVAMTYDDGPHAENTPRLLEILKKRNIKATFFVVGQCAAEYPEIMKRIVADGHEVASHSWSHPQLSRMAEEGVAGQLQRTHDVIVETTGVAPKVMRPPYGALTPNQRAWANRRWGYKVILWDVDPLDWKYRNAARVQSEIVRQTVPGSIILSHDIHKSTVDAMPETLDALTSKGFKFVTVSELVAMERPAPPRTKAGPVAGQLPGAAPVRSEPSVPAERGAANPSVPATTGSSKNPAPATAQPRSE